METTRTYRGPERRHRQRRESADRRDLIRFEPEKTPRRSGKDRRIDHSAWGGSSGR